MMLHAQSHHAQEWSEKKQREAGSRLPSTVYIEAEVCGPGPKENFDPTDKGNEAVKVTEAFRDFMDSNKNVMLLSGAAVSRVYGLCVVM